jgi:predicted MFS family arabinose efflux permease
LNRRHHDARRRVVIVLMTVLALEAADRSVLGALAPTLERVFGIHHTELGVLAAAVTLVGAAATLPVGVGVDRMRRITLLTWGVATWSVGMVASGAALSFAMLFGARLFLGAMSAVAYPTVASLTGDLYSMDERGNVLGQIRTGEMIGAGAGLLAAGGIGALLSWRWVFWLLAVLGIALVVAMHHVREPPRTKTPGAPRQARMPLREVVRYVFEIRTNVLLVIGGSVGDFFFSALQLFLVSFVVHQYGISQYEAVLLVPVVGVGALVGLLGGGRLGDWLIEHGHVSGRVALGAMSFIVVSPLLVPLFFLTSLGFAVPLMMIDGALLAINIPTLDASRLDVVHPRLWGRAEAVRTAARTLAQVVAPVLVGLLADHLAGGRAEGLRLAFLVLLPALAINGVVLLFAVRTFPDDVRRAADVT